MNELWDQDSNEHGDQMPQVSGAPIEYVAGDYETEIGGEPDITAPIDAGHEQHTTALGSDTLRQVLQADYEAHAPDVAHLTEVWKQRGGPEYAPGYIETASEVAVFRLPEDSGLVVKIPHYDLSNQEGVVMAMERRVDALLAGKNLPSLEQIVAYREDPELPTVICEYVAGEIFEELDDEQRLAIPQAHYEALLDTYELMQQHGLHVDVGPANVIYDPEKGFTVIDYRLDPEQTLVQKILNFTDSDVLLGNINGGAVPEYALRFKELCRTRYGQLAADAIELQWEAFFRTANYDITKLNAYKAFVEGLGTNAILETLEPDRAASGDQQDQWLRARFAACSDEVVALRQLAAEVADISAVPGYVDSATEVDVFRLPSNPDHIVKIPRQHVEEDPLGRMQTRIDALQQGKGVAGLEQIVAYSKSADMPAVICEYVEGTPFFRLDAGQRATIPEEHFLNLIATYCDMQARGLDTAGGVKNLIYHPEEGFTVIDYEVHERQTAEDKVVLFATGELMIHAADGEQIPDYAVRFLEVCRLAFGNETVERIKAHWRQSYGV